MTRNATIGSWEICMGYIQLPTHIRATVDNGESRFGPEEDFDPPLKRFRFHLTDEQEAIMEECCIPMVNEGCTVSYMYQKLIELEKLPVDKQGRQFHYYRFELYIVKLRKKLGRTGNNRKTSEKIYREFLSGRYTHIELAERNNIKLDSLYAVISRERKRQGLTKQQEKELQNGRTWYRHT